MSKIRKGPHNTAGLLAFVTIGVFCIVFFADRGRFEVPISSNAVTTVLAPFQRAAAWVGDQVHDGLANVWEIMTVHEQNKMLKNEVRQLRELNRQANEYASENVRLRALLGYKQVATQFDLVMGRIIGREAATWTSTVVIDRGSGDGLKKNMPVVTERGLVGNVTEVNLLSAKVELLIDPRAAVGSLVQRSRVVGIVQGDREDRFRARMVNIPRNADIVVGDDIVTSGFGGIFPKGLPIGKVIDIRNDSGGLLKYAVIESLVDFQKLEDVAVIVNSREAPPDKLMPPPMTPGTENLASSGGTP